jgi:GntR family transcriptional regulator, histidine utilization repressor
MPGTENGVAQMPVRRKKAPGAAAGAAPRGQQIKQYILAKIVSGEWGANHAVPSESELKRRFDCARMTVHYALRELRDEGYLARVQGVGTFVAPPHVHVAVFRLKDIADHARETGSEHSMRVLSKAERRATRAEALEFRVAAGALLYKVAILHMLDGKAVQLERRTVNAQVVPDFLQADFTRRTPFSVLMERLPYPEGQMAFSAVIPGSADCRLLQVPGGTACLLSERMTWSPAAVFSRASVILAGPGHIVAQITPPLGAMLRGTQGSAQNPL